MRKYKDKVIWITGASSGIGEAVAYRFAKAGAKLILTSRKEDLLEKVAAKCREEGAADAWTLPCDLGKLDELHATAIQAWDIHGTIDVLVANAGISQRCETDKADMQLIRKVMELDFCSPAIITKAILPKMLEQGGGQLVCTGSIAGLFGSRQRCAYGSAKAALQRFYETINAEYWESGIRATVIIPGRVRTAISMSALEAGCREHGKMDPGQEKGISCEKAAEKIYKAIARCRREKLVGGTELLMAYFKRFLPGLCFRISRSVGN